MLYLGLLKKYRDETGVKIIAYCLMENHVHLLVQDPNKHISEFMHNVNCCYAAYFNSTYERVGHLFQDRFRSENICDEQYMLTVFKYILMNPQKAGICPAHKYPWSSFDEYQTENGLTDTSLIKELIGFNISLQDLFENDEQAECLDIDMPRHDDVWANKIIQSVTGSSSGMILQNMSRTAREPIIRVLKHKGLTLKQLVRLTGLSYGTIQRVK